MQDREENWDKYIDPRIDDLRVKGFYLEAFYLCSATIEHSLQRAIELQETWIEKTLARTHLSFKKTDQSKLREMTLGQLIANFARYCDDKILVSKLNQFNSLRIKFVHKLLDYSIEELNEEAKKNFLSYYHLVSGIYRYMAVILEKQNKSLKRQLAKTNRA